MNTNDTPKMAALRTDAETIDALRENNAELWTRNAGWLDYNYAVLRATIDALRENNAELWTRNAGLLEGIAALLDYNYGDMRRTIDAQRENNDLLFEVIGDLQKKIAEKPQENK